MNKKTWATALMLMASPLAFGAQRTITLDVAGMTCGACPITVKKSLTKVSGVSRAEINYDKRQAVVTFDDAQTTLEKLTRATSNAGFPSKVRGTEQ